MTSGRDDTHPAVTGEELLQALMNLGKEPQDVIRTVAAADFQGAHPDRLPWTALCVVFHTKPSPIPDAKPEPIELADIYPRVPAYFRGHMPELIRETSVVDVSYAKVRNRHHPISILSDELMPDDMYDRYRPIDFPGDPIGKAIRHAATSRGARVRCWQVIGASRIWKSMTDETRLYELQQGLTPGEIAHTLARMQQMTLEEWEREGEQRYRDLTGYIT